MAKRRNSKFSAAACGDAVARTQWIPAFYLSHIKEEVKLMEDLVNNLVFFAPAALKSQYDRGPFTGVESRLLTPHRIGQSTLPILTFGDLLLVVLPMEIVTPLVTKLCNQTQEIFTVVRNFIGGVAVLADLICQFACGCPDYIISSDSKKYPVAREVLDLYRYFCSTKFSRSATHRQECDWQNSVLGANDTK